MRPLCDAGGFAFELVMTHRRECVQHVFKRERLKIQPIKHPTFGIK